MGHHSLHSECQEYFLESGKFDLLEVKDISCKQFAK